MDGTEKLNVRKLLELVQTDLSSALENHLFEPNEPVDEPAFVQRQVDELERLKREGLVVSYTVPPRPLEDEWTIVLPPPITITAKLVANDDDGSL